MIIFYFSDEEKSQDDFLRELVEKYGKHITPAKNSKNCTVEFDDQERDLKDLDQESVQINIRFFRKKKKLSQMDLANLMGVDQTAISQWETNRTKPTIDNLVSLSKILGCTVQDLIKANCKRTEINQIDENNDFPTNLRILRKSLKLTQEQLAERLNIPYRSLLNWELGKREPSARNLCLLAKYFNVDPTLLIGRDTEVVGTGKK